MYVCICKGIRESDVLELGRSGVTCPKAIASSLGIDDKNNCCGRCIKRVSHFVKMAAEAHSHHSVPVST
jgi:bacterioferritin-associated ferredoxin